MSFNEMSPCHIFQMYVVLFIFSFLLLSLLIKFFSLLLYFYFEDFCYYLVLVCKCYSYFYSRLWWCAHLLQKRWRSCHPLMDVNLETLSRSKGLSVTRRPSSTLKRRYLKPVLRILPWTVARRLASR